MNKEQIENFKLWVNGWDERIHTHDDRETEQSIIEKLQNGFGSIEELLISSTDSAIQKATSKLTIGTNEYNEAYVKAMQSNQSKQWFKNLSLVRDDINYIRNIIRSIYELKNRRNLEVFKLRSENSKLRTEIERLKNL